MSNFLEFLSLILSSGAAYSTINSHKAALSLILDIDLEGENIIKRFLKGSFNIKPPKPKYAITWDPQPVLNYLGKLYPNNNLNLEQLTLKLTTLIALATAQRAQTISKIELDNILRQDDRVEIRIPARIKTSGKIDYSPT